MTLIERLEGSYLVQEQEAAEHIRELYNALLDIKLLVYWELFDTKKDILDIIDMVTKDGYN